MEQHILLESYLKRLKLPSMLNHYQETARQARQDNQAYEGYLSALVEMEVILRDENSCKRRIAAARFPLAKTLDQFDFSALPALNKATVLNLARGEYIDQKENLIFMGNSGTGKTHLATAMGLRACQQGRKVRFFTAAGLVNHLVEAQGALRLSGFQRTLANLDLIIIDEIGYVPFSESGARLFFQAAAESYERRSILMTTNLDFSKWPQVFHCEQLTGAMLDRLTHHAHIVTMNGDSYRFKHTMARKTRP